MSRISKKLAINIPTKICLSMFDIFYSSMSGLVLCRLLLIASYFCYNMDFFQWQNIEWIHFLLYFYYKYVLNMNLQCYVYSFPLFIKYKYKLSNLRDTVYQLRESWDSYK